MHVTQFYQAFPHVNTASDKHWGEMVWVRGYKHPTHRIICDDSSLTASY